MIETPISHKNGRGKIYGDEADVSLNTFLSNESVVRGHSDVAHSKIYGKSKIVDSIVASASVHSSTIQNSIVSGGLIIDSTINCELVAGTNLLIKDSHLSGDTKIMDGAHLHSCRIHNLLVMGNAQLKNIIIEDGCWGRISSGIWHRSPRIKRLADYQITITESTNENAFIGCREYPIKHWIAGRYRFGRAGGWSKVMADEVAEMLIEWLRTPVYSSQTNL